MQLDLSIWVPSLGFQNKQKDCKCMSIGEKRNPNVADYIICYINSLKTQREF